MEDQWRGTPMWPVNRDVRLTSTDVLDIFNRLLAHIQDLAERVRTVRNSPSKSLRDPEGDDAASRSGPTRE